MVQSMLSSYPNDYDRRRNNPGLQLPPLRWYQYHSTWIHYRKGKQRYRCRICGRSFVQDPTSAAYAPVRKEEILCTYHERASLRGISRIFGVSRNTLTRWLKKSWEPATSEANAGSRGSRGGSRGDTGAG